MKRINITYSARLRVHTNISRAELDIFFEFESKRALKLMQLLIDP